MMPAWAAMPLEHVEDLRLERRAREARGRPGWDDRTIPTSSVGVAQAQLGDNVLADAGGGGGGIGVQAGSTASDRATARAAGTQDGNRGPTG